MDDSATDASDPTPSRNRFVRMMLTVVVLVFAVFWIWALFFASKEAVNKVDDRAWAERAERICVAATEERFELTDFTRIDRPTPALMQRRADVVDEATDILERMLDDIVAVAPSDDKGQAIVPMWEDDYRTYLNDRRVYADQLRASEENLSFYETAEGGVPISERISTFAGDNEMPACAPPFDLSR